MICGRFHPGVRQERTSGWNLSKRIGPCSHTGMWEVPMQKRRMRLANTWCAPVMTRHGMLGCWQLNAYQRWLPNGIVPDICFALPLRGLAPKTKRGTPRHVSLDGKVNFPKGIIKVGTHGNTTMRFVVMVSNAKPLSETLASRSRVCDIKTSSGKAGSGRQV